MSSAFIGILSKKVSASCCPKAMCPLAAKSTRASAVSLDVSVTRPAREIAASAASESPMARSVRCSWTLSK
ncbi:MAG: hypothetical protein AVDCRST_MAG93-9887 [uncultured Chloroflexia bacterium]|uniref:Uncharacterized protein n=1 Tax=uncultured Chloroflexia bacterium TaxID=1672391 RepID=A0A6J4NW85_9CHLR|nr:MAG: hypothetical protein AVDCRST_MAG93-9887 [uncultured Chloroflexia bacterium]